jgi:glutathione S-transferase
MKLHGFPISNYYNMVKMVLLEKGMDFEEVFAKPSQGSDYLVYSPMGKVPCLETEQGFLTETGVIIDYLDDLGVGPSFYPSDAFERAKVRELMRYLELYVELPARRLYGDAFFKRPANDELKQEVRKSLGRGFEALAAILHEGPYVCGAQLTYGDIYYYFTMSVVARMAKLSLDWDAYNEIPGLRARMELLGQRESIQRIHADQRAAG